MADDLSARVAELEKQMMGVRLAQATMTEKAAAIEKAVDTLVATDQKREDRRWRSTLALAVGLIVMLVQFGLTISIAAK